MDNIDIVDRLRGHDPGRSGCEKLMYRAADEIEWLRAENKEQSRLLGMSGERELSLLASNRAMESALRRIESECLFDADRDDLRGWIVDCVEATIDDDALRGEKQ